MLSGCVGLSLIVSMVISSLVGTVIPMLFHKIHIDPAVASGPLITTINDLVAVVVYYGLAMVVCSLICSIWAKISIKTKKAPASPELFVP